MISTHKSGESIAATLMLGHLRHLAGVSVKKDPQQETIMMDSFYEERICTGDEYSRESILEALVGIGVGVSHFD